MATSGVPRSSAQVRNEFVDQLCKPGGFVEYKQVPLTCVPPVEAHMFYSWAYIPVDSKVIGLIPETPDRPDPRHLVLNIWVPDQAQARGAQLYVGFLVLSPRITRRVPADWVRPQNLVGTFKYTDRNPRGGATNDYHAYIIHRIALGKAD